MRWTLRGLAVERRMALSTTGPMVMLGTKRPSITSTWIQSAPAMSTARTSSPRRAKSADSIDGATSMEATMVLEPALVEWTETHERSQQYITYPGPAAARSTNQTSSPTGLTRAAGTSLPPARIVRKIAAFSLPATRKATRRLLSITG